MKFFRYIFALFFNIRKASEAVNTASDITEFESLAGISK